MTIKHIFGGKGTGVSVQLPVVEDKRQGRWSVLIVLVKRQIWTNVKDKNSHLTKTIAIRNLVLHGIMVNGVDVTSLVMEAYQTDW